MGLPQLPTNWSQIPMVYVTILFGLGLLVDNWIHTHPEPILYATLSLLIFLIASPKNLLNYTIKCHFLILTIFCSGLLHSSYQQKKRDFTTNYYDYSNSTITYSAEIVKISESEKYENLLVHFFAFNNSKGSMKKTPRSKGILKIKKDESSLTFKVGDHIQTRLKLASTTPNENKNEYLDFLFNQGISHLSYVNTDQIKKLNSKPSILKTVRYKIRNEALAILDDNIHDQHARSISKALLLGYKNEIDKTTIEFFKDSGTMHVLAVSGLHVGIVAFIIFQIIGKVFFFIPRYAVPKVTLIILGLIFFAEISGGAPPVWRAVLVSILYLFGRSFSYKSMSINLVGTAAFLILLFDARAIFSLSFQLSFTAVIGIILIYPIFESAYTPKGVILKYLIGIIYMGTAAQLAITPLAIYYFNQVSLLSPLTSIVTISLAFLIIYIGALLFLTAWVHPLLGVIYSRLIQFLSDLMIETSRFMSNVRLGVLKDVTISPIEAWIIGCAILIITIAFYKRSIKLAKVFLLLIATQGFLHTLYSIEHTRCIEVIRTQKSHAVGEIFIGRESFIINPLNNDLYHRDLKRKEHRIHKLININDSSYLLQRNN